MPGCCKRSPFPMRDSPARNTAVWAPIVWLFSDRFSVSVSCRANLAPSHIYALYLQRPADGDAGVLHCCHLIPHSLQLVAVDAPAEQAAQTRETQSSPHGCDHVLTS